MPLSICKQNAKELAAKSHEARRRNKELRLQAELDEANKPQPEQQIAAPEPAQAYIQRRLARVREQIERLSDMLDEETDPNKLDRIASAIDRLDEMERKHAGRPLPGSLKPSTPRQAQRSATVEPIGPAPLAPGVSSTVQVPDKQA